MSLFLTPYLSKVISVRHFTQSRIDTFSGEHTPLSQIILPDFCAVPVFPGV